MSGIYRNPGEAIAAGEPPDGLRPSSAVQREIEVILARQLAGYLAFPIVIVDPAHIVIYYNEPAERMLGRRFDEGRPVPWTDWSQTFSLKDDAGEPIVSAETPLATALRDRRPVHRTISLQSLAGIRRHYAVTAIPLTGNASRFLGAIAIFAEITP